LIVIVNEDSSNVLSIDVDGDDHRVSVWKRCHVDIFGRECDGHVRPHGFDDGTFNSHVVDLSIIVSSLSLIFKVGIGASGDGEDCVMGGEIVALLQRLTSL
jgi:hypothetical protein